MQPDDSPATPASFAQRSMWAAAQRGRGAPLNVFLLRWRLRGELQRDALVRAVGNLCMRHPILRARLVLEGGQLMQRIDPIADIPVKFEEAQGPDEQTRLASTVRLLREAGRAGMDLSTGPVLKVVLVRLSAADHLLCFIAHHAVCDGWSSQVLLRDLAAFYAAHAAGTAIDLPRLTEHYADFAAEQMRTWRAGGYAEEIEYWRDELAAPPPPVELPALRPRRGLRDWECEFPAQMESAQVHAAIKDVARRSRVSVFAVLLAGFAVLLSQRTAARDMLIGVSTLNRWNTAHLQFVGCATNLLPARIRMDAAMPFTELCAQVNATVRRLVNFGRVPLEVLLRETQGGLIAGPALPIWCQFREWAPSIEAAGMLMTPLQIERASLQCELELDLLGSNEGLRCEFAFRPALFASSTVAGLMTDYASIVRTVAKAPQTRVVHLASALDLRERPSCP